MEPEIEETVYIRSPLIGEKMGGTSSRPPRIGAHGYIVSSARSVVLPQSEIFLLENPESFQTAL